MATLNRWDPFAELLTLQREANRLFERTFGDWGFDGERTTRPYLRTWEPLVDICETADEVIVQAELPGLRLEDIKVELNGSYLTIEGERPWEEKEGHTYYRTERPYGRFFRRLAVNVPVDANRVQASYNAGVLAIRLPKAEEAKPKQVEVKAE